MERLTCARGSATDEPSEKDDTDEADPEGDGGLSATAFSAAVPACMPSSPLREGAHWAARRNAARFSAARAARAPPEPVRCGLTCIGPWKSKNNLKDESQRLWFQRAGPTIDQG